MKKNQLFLLLSFLFIQLHANNQNKVSDDTIIALADQKQEKIDFNFNEFYKKFWNSIKTRWIKEFKQEFEKDPFFKVSPQQALELAQKAFEKQKTYYDDNKEEIGTAIKNQLQWMGTGWLGQKFRTQLYRWLQR